MKEDESGIVISPVINSSNAFDSYRLLNDERYWEMEVTVVGNQNKPFEQIIFALEDIDSDSLGTVTRIYESVIEDRFDSKVEAYSESYSSAC